jgi:hypothetical protein
MRTAINIVPDARTAAAEKSADFEPFFHCCRPGREIREKIIYERLNAFEKNSSYGARSRNC